MNLTPWRKPPSTDLVERAGISFDEWANLASSFGFNGVRYSLPGASQELIGGNFVGLARNAYKANGVVFACMVTRMLLFSEARFQFRQVRGGRPGSLFGTADLEPLEAPYPGGTTGDLLTKAICDVDIAGNWFGTNRYGGIRRLRPDWVTLVLGSFANPNVAAWDADADVVGYIYQPGGPGGGREPITFLHDEVAHYCPIPDPEAQFRGMSWLTPIIREIMADKAMVDHKLAFLENGATPNLVVKMDMPDLQKAEPWIDLFKRNHEGATNAYKTIFLGGGADATVVGVDLKQLDFKTVQGAGETRIAAAARVPPIIVGLSEGLEAATYSNYGQARRAFADATMRPLWRNFAGSLARIINVPPGSELWYDDRDISFLQEDQADAANIQATEATSIRTLVDGGFRPDTVIDAVTAADWSRLEHTGLFSIQLQPPADPDADPVNPDLPVPIPTAPAPTGSTATPATEGANGSRRDETIEMLEGFLRMSEERERQPHHIEVHVPETRVEIGEGAIQNHVTIEGTTAEPARMEIADGAFTSHVTVEPSRTEIHEGAFRAGDVAIEKGAVEVNVETPDVRLEEGAIVSNVTVEPAVTEIQRGAVEVTVEAAEAPDVNVTVEPAEVRLERGAVEVTVQPEITVEAAQTPDVTVNVEPPNVTLERGAVEVTVEPGNVNVEAPNTQIDVHVPMPEQEITIETRAADTVAPVVNVTVEPTPVTVENEINVPPPANKTIRFERDGDGAIVEASSEDAGDDNETDQSV